MSRLGQYATASAALALTMRVPQVYAQCSVCQAALANAENNGQITSAFNQGIGLMFVVMGALGVIGWRIARRARNEFEIRKSQHSNTVFAPNSGLPAENSASR